MKVRDRAFKILRISHSLKQKGFYSIFVSQIINNILLFGTSVLVVRLINKEDFGRYSYAYNIISLFLLINGIGMLSGFLQFGSEFSDDKVKSSAYEKYAFKTGIIASISISVIIMGLVKFGNNSINQSSILLLLLSLIPIFHFAYTFFETKFRVLEMNKKYSLLINLNSITYFVSVIIGSVFMNVVGIILAKYLAYSISIIYGIYSFKKSNRHIVSKESYHLDKIEKKEFLKLSVITAFNNAISQMLYLIDVFIIGLILVDTSIIASYKTATIIPFALNFIPTSIMIFIYPKYAKNNRNLEYIRKYTKQIIGLLLVGNLFISIFLVVFSKNIVYLLFGIEYGDSIKPFIILSICYFISGTFRIPFGNILFSMKRVKFNLFVSILTGLVNIILNYLLITKYGSIGASYTTISVYLLSSLLSVTYFLRVTRKGAFEIEQ